MALLEYCYFPTAIRAMLYLGGLAIVNFSKSNDMLSNVEDQIGNDRVYTAAGFGRLRHTECVIDVRVGRLRYRVVLDLQSYLVAASRIVVNHDGHGGTAHCAPVWDGVSLIATGMIFASHGGCSSSALGLILYAASDLTLGVVAIWAHSVTLWCEFFWISGIHALVS